MNDYLSEEESPVRQSGLATPGEWENWSGRGTIVRRMPSGTIDDDASDASEDDGHYRTNALGRDDADDIARFRAMMGITLPPAAAQRPRPQPARQLPPFIDESSDDDSDTESLQTRESLPVRGGLDINAGLGPRVAQARPGAMNFSRYFSTFGARTKQAGILGALFGRGGARAEAAAQAAAARAAKQARKAQAAEARWDAFRKLKAGDNAYVSGLSRNRTSPDDYSDDDVSRWETTHGRDESLNPFTRMAASSKAVLAAANADSRKDLTVAQAKRFMARQQRGA
jgi:hypothetical protein